MFSIINHSCWNCFYSISYKANVCFASTESIVKPSYDFFPLLHDIFFLIANTEINMSKHSFPVSSHVKVAWAIHSFCCLYYPVENRDNLALSQAPKKKVKTKSSCQ